MWELQTSSSLQAGGATAPPANGNQVSDRSFEYDGTSWTAGNNMLIQQDSGKYGFWIRYRYSRNCSMAGGASSWKC